MPADGSEPKLVAIDFAAIGDPAATLLHWWEQGHAILPLEPDAPPAVTERLLAFLRPDLVVTSEGRSARLDDPLPTPAGTALVVATSGSTGVPKGVTLSHDALAASTRAGLEALGATRGQRWLGCLPLQHVAGLQTILRARELGTDPVLHPRFDVSAVAAAATPDLWVSLVPTMLHRLLEAGAPIERFAGILLGGAAAGEDLLAAARATGAHLVTSYGMTETCGGCLYDGRPLRDVEVALSDDGRVALRGPMLLTDYRGDPVATAAALVDGWLLTSDAGHRAPDGRIHINGRIDDIIVTGGENVSATSIRERLLALPGIVDAGVVGVADDEWGQRVVAVCVAETGTAPPDPEAVRRAVRDRLGAPAAPREVIYVARLPRDAMGKITAGALRTLATRAVGR